MDQLIAWDVIYSLDRWKQYLSLLIHEIHHLFEGVFHNLLSYHDTGGLHCQCKNIKIIQHRATETPKHAETRHVTGRATRLTHLSYLAPANWAACKTTWTTDNRIPAPPITITAQKVSHCAESLLSFQISFHPRGFKFDIWHWSIAMRLLRTGKSRLRR